MDAFTPYARPTSRPSARLVDSVSSAAPDFAIRVRKPSIPGGTRPDAPLTARLAVLAAALGVPGMPVPRMLVPRMLVPRMLVLGILTPLLLVTGCDCAGKDRDGSETLVVYSGRTEALVAPVVAAFEAEAGVRVKVNYGDTAQLAAAVLEEAVRSPADVFLAQDVSTLGVLEARDRLRPLPDDILERVDRRLRSPQATWVATSARARVLAYNPQRVQTDALPARLDDLTKPEWAGRVGWAPANASFQSFIAAFLQLEGKDKVETWLRAMQANRPRVYASNTPLVLAVASGEIDVGLTNHYYMHRLTAEHGEAFAADNHYFDRGGPGALVNVSAVGVLASSERQALAERFAAFLLSETAQAHFARANYEIPVAAGVAPDPALPELEHLDVPELDLTALADLETAVRLLRETRVLL